MLYVKLSYNFCQVHGNSESFNLQKDQQFFCTFEKAKMNLALVYGTGLCLFVHKANICREFVRQGNLASKNLCSTERLAMVDGDKTAQPTGRARGRARGRPRTAEELAAMRRPGETTTTPATSVQG